MRATAADRPTAGPEGSILTEDRARTIANVILGVAVAVAGYYVLRTPPLRRAALRLVATSLTVTLPAWFSGEVRRAWQESAAD